MAKVSLSGMTVEALMDLRERVEGLLSERHAELQEQLERMDRAVAAVSSRGGQGASALRGRKVPPKYRSPAKSPLLGKHSSAQEAIKERHKGQING